MSSDCRRLSLLCREAIATLKTDKPFERMVFELRADLLSTLATTAASLGAPSPLGVKTFKNGSVVVVTWKPGAQTMLPGWKKEYVLAVNNGSWHGMPTGKQVSDWQPAIDFLESCERYFSEHEPSIDKQKTAKGATNGHRPPAKDENAATGAMGPCDISDAFAVPLKALQNRLSRLRMANSDAFIEAVDRKPREPQFLYFVSHPAVWSIIQQLKRE